MIEEINKFIDKGIEQTNNFIDNYPQLTMLMLVGIILLVVFILILLRTVGSNKRIIPIQKTIVHHVNESLKPYEREKHIIIHHLVTQKQDFIPTTEKEQQIDDNWLDPFGYFKYKHFRY